MRRILYRLLAAGALAAVMMASAAAQGNPGWSQWGRDARHHGMAPVAGQSLDRLLADLVYDPFVEQERAEQFGILAAHFQVPLVDGDDVLMEWKTGTYIPCDPPGWMTTEPCGVNSWNTQIWNERRLHWEGGKLVEKWTFASDWKPAPVPALNFLGPSEPVFTTVAASPRCRPRARRAAAARSRRQDLYAERRAPFRDRGVSGIKKTDLPSVACAAEDQKQRTPETIRTSKTGRV